MSHPLLEARDLARHYRAPGGYFGTRRLVRALDGVSFTLAAGRTLAVVGESGCGKSTLARQVTMVEAPTAGELRFDGRDVHADPALRARLRPQVQMVFQNPLASLNPRRTAGQLLEEPLAIQRRGTQAERREAAQAMLATVGLRREHYARYPHMFSGGQCQRIAIARALMLRPRLLLLDEPTAGMGDQETYEITRLIRRLHRDEKLSIVLIEHDMRVIFHLADRIMVLAEGEVLAEGTPDEIGRDERVQAAYLGKTE
jgi:dipeptide transport system ATP-binding protein